MNKNNSVIDLTFMQFKKREKVISYNQTVANKH